MFQRRKPIFHRVTKLLKVSILRRPIMPRLKLPMKTRRSTKKVKLLQQYKYKFLQEYQLSPSRTFLIRYRRKRIRISTSGLRRISKLLFLSQCIGRSSYDEPLCCGHGVASPASELPQPFDYLSEDDSIDLKAERFIEKFYVEMRMQAREFA